MKLLHHIIWSTCLFFSIFTQGATTSPFVVSYFQNNNASNNDLYNLALLTLALEKTRHIYGDYTLSPIDTIMTPKRRMALLVENQHPNLVVMLGFAELTWPQTDLAFIDFPIDLGILGWRICFVSPQAKARVAQAQSIDELRQFSIAQGAHWRDTDILRENGFRVIESPTYTALFSMITRGRADLFCRGINEIANEYEKFKHIENLYYDESFAFSYRMPIFFHVHKKNTLVKRRIEEGLKLAYEDGSLMKLWLDTFKASVLFSNIKQRRVFNLKYNAAKKPPPGYDKYVLDPAEIK